MAHITNDYLTVDEVARLLGIQPASVREYTRTGRVIEPDLRPTARAMLWERARFFQWLEAQSRQRQEAANAS